MTTDDIIEEEANEREIQRIRQARLRAKGLLPSTEQPRPEQGNGETTRECGFDEAWIGKCKQIGNPRCAKHTGRVCVSCGADAVRNCEETGQFVCGAGLCGDCEHTIFPSGTNGGIGFNAQSLPEGMSRHCKKTEQKFKPWYARDDNEDDDAPAAPERGERWTSVNMTEDPRDPRFTIEEGDKLLATAYDAATAAQIITEHNQRSTLIAQRERLLRAAQFALSTPGMIRGRDSLQQIVDEVLTTIEQEGTTRQ